MIEDNYAPLFCVARCLKSASRIQSPSKPFSLFWFNFLHLGTEPFQLLNAALPSGAKGTDMPGQRGRKRRPPRTACWSFGVGTESLRSIWCKIFVRDPLGHRVPLIKHTWARNELVQTGKDTHGIMIHDQACWCLWLGTRHFNLFVSSWRLAMSWGKWWIHVWIFQRSGPKDNF